MNSTLNSLYNEISKPETKKIPSDVNQIMASHSAQEKIFTTAELWNIQRQRRSALQKRHLL